MTFFHRYLGRNFNVRDTLYLIFITLSLGMAWAQWHTFMDGYEQIILFATLPSLALFGLFWPAFQFYFPTALLGSSYAIWLYQGDISRDKTVFGLKYLFSSQNAILWMCALLGCSALMYLISFIKTRRLVPEIAYQETMGKIATGLMWAASIMGLLGLMVRWYESYLLLDMAGHIPVSNLYEVFVVFIVITNLMYLYYEASFKTRQTGIFVVSVILAAVAFLLWYSVTRGAHEIMPLIPALQSWWMKIHVPANFIGYGAFAIAAMLGVAWLLAVPEANFQEKKQSKIATDAEKESAQHQFNTARQENKRLMQGLIAISAVIFVLLFTLGKGTLQFDQQARTSTTSTSAIDFVLSADAPKSSHLGLWLAIKTDTVVMNAPSNTETPLSTLGKRVLFFAYAALCFSLLGLLTQYRGTLADYLPKPHVIEEISYRAISVGFLFFTIATILGAMWAADAWGGYWSWDPKETWALIVWVNYACWLHLRLIKGVRTEVLAWWAIVGLFLTTFAFLGVNMLLTGLHSYGGL